MVKSGPLGQYQSSPCQRPGACRTPFTATHNRQVGGAKTHEQETEARKQQTSVLIFVRSTHTFNERAQLVHATVRSAVSVSTRSASALVNAGSSQNAAVTAVIAVPTAGPDKPAANAS